MISKNLKSGWQRRKKRADARKVAEEQGRAKYGDGYKASEQDIQKVLEEM